MRIKMKTGYGITGLLMVGCRIKTFWLEQDLLFLTSGMRDRFKIDGRMRVEMGIGKFHAKG